MCAAGEVTTRSIGSAASTGPRGAVVGEDRALGVVVAP